MPSFSKCSSLIVCQIKQSFGVLYSLQVMHDLLWTGTFWPFTSETRDRKMLSLITAVIFPPEKVGKTTAQLEHLKHRKGVKTSQCHQIMIWPYVLSLKTTLSFVKWKKWSFNSTPPPSIEDLHASSLHRIRTDHTQLGLKGYNQNVSLQEFKLLRLQRSLAYFLKDNRYGCFRFGSY